MAVPGCPSPVSCVCHRPSPWPWSLPYPLHRPVPRWAARPVGQAQCGARVGWTAAATSRPIVLRQRRGSFRGCGAVISAQPLASSRPPLSSCWSHLFATALSLLSRPLPQPLPAPLQDGSQAARWPGPASPYLLLSPRRPLCAGLAALRAGAAPLAFHAPSPLLRPPRRSLPWRPLASHGPQPRRVPWAAPGRTRRDVLILHRSSRAVHRTS